MSAAASPDRYTYLRATIRIPHRRIKVRRDTPPTGSGRPPDGMRARAPALIFPE